MRRPIAAGAAVVVIAGAIAWWAWPAPPSPGMRALLPPGAVVVSRARVELDGRPPAETVATIALPSAPGADVTRAYGVVVAYVRWRHRWGIRLFDRLDGSPGVVSAGPLLGGRPAVVFPAYGEDGRVHYRVYSYARGRAVLRHEGETAGTVEAYNGLLLERGSDDVRAHAWDGRTFVAAPAPSLPPATIVWRYWVDRLGLVRGETKRVALRPGQRLLLVRNGGGITETIIAEAGLDTLENGYRAREPGEYLITVMTGLEPQQDRFRLTVEVEE